jgi:hypothetical protein
MATMRHFSTNCTANSEGRQYIFSIDFATLNEAMHESSCPASIKLGRNSDAPISIRMDARTRVLGEMESDCMVEAAPGSSSDMERGQHLVTMQFRMLDVRRRIFNKTSQPCANILGTSLTRGLALHRIDTTTGPSLEVKPFSTK